MALVVQMAILRCFNFRTGQVKYPLSFEKIDLKLEIWG